VFDSLASMHGPLSMPTRWLLRAAGAVESLVQRRYWHPRARHRGLWLTRKTAATLREDQLVTTGQIDVVAAKP
jgi:hypothetical protein